MAAENENTTWIQIAGLPKKQLTVSSKAEAELYRMAEDLVNKVWGEYETKYKSEKTSSNDIMAMVAFYFAWKYVNSKQWNSTVNDFLKEFEKKLDDIVVKV